MTTELIIINTGENGIQSVSARELYEQLGLDKSNWSRWAKQNIIENTFAIERDDYEGFVIMTNGNETTDFALSIPFAKKLAMQVKTAQGEKVRNYFLECEKKALQPAPQKEISRLEMAQMLLQAEVDREAAEKQVKKLETEKRFNAPKVEAWDDFLESDSLYTMTTAFKMLKLQPNVHIKRLREEGVLYKLQKTNIPAEPYIKRGYFNVKVNRNLQNGKDYPQTYVTAKGLGVVQDKVYTAEGCGNSALVQAHPLQPTGAGFTILTRALETRLLPGL